MRGWPCSRLLVSTILLVALAPRPSAAQSTPAAGVSADTFFDDTAIRDLNLDLNSKDWAALKAAFESNTYYSCQMTWNGLTVQNVGIRSRGSGSRSGVKPGLRVDFDRYSSKQTFLGLKSFILDNLVQDSSMLKERLSMLFFRRMGLPAPREAHLRLFVNGRYVGLYAVVEAIDKVFLGRNFGADEDGGVENDGYLFEYDWTSEYRFEYLGDDLGAYAMFKPKTRESEAASKIWGPIEKMVKTINESPDALFVEDVSKYLDLSLFAKHVAIENFLSENDGILGYAGLNNFYFYRFEGRKLSQFIVWDKDNTFLTFEYPIMQGIAQNVLARRALGQGDYRKVYLETLTAAAESADEPEIGPDGERPEPGDTASPGWLEREITREYQQIRTLAREDTLKPWTNDDFEAAIQQLLEFARHRPAFVKAEVKNAAESR